MRKLQQFRVTLEKGKQKSKDQVGTAKKVVDSAAEHLVLESKLTLERETEISKNKSTPVRIFNIWEDKGELKKVKKTKKKEDK